MSPSNHAEMHPELMLLLELQDLRTQHRELGSEGETGLGGQEAEHFHIDLGDARDRLAEKIEELEEKLSPEIRARYERILPHRERVVVPVIQGVCYGCFVSIATATVGDQGVHAGIENCEGCGSFIYILS